MKYRYLGQTGVKVSELCLGAMTFGRETDQETSHAIMDRFVQVGGNLLDTANVYSAGVSERIVGSWMKDRGNRADLVIATKVHFPMGAGPNDGGLSRKHILAQIHASLDRLQTDYIDLYQVHCWDPGTPLEETLSTLNDIVRAGKARYIGASNYAGWQLIKALMTSSAHNWEPFACLQAQYSLLERHADWELIPVCSDMRLALIVWSPLGGGWLTGKYSREDGKPLGGTRAGEAQPWSAEFWDRRDNDRTWGILHAVSEIAQVRGTTPAQVALNWLRTRPIVTAPIIGARTMEQLEDDLRCIDWSLSTEEMTQLDGISAISPEYPYSYIDDFAGDRMR